ncbi:MAG: hypothetical protein AB3N34_03035 [Lettuce witches'-broom phytoplasma]
MKKGLKAKELKSEKVGSLNRQLTSLKEEKVLLEKEVGVLKSNLQKIKNESSSSGHHGSEGPLYEKKYQV